MPQRRTRQKYSHRRSTPTRRRASSTSQENTRKSERQTPSENPIEISSPREESEGISRRHFLYGIAGVAAVAVVAGGGFAISRATGSSGSSNVSADEILAVAEDNVFTTDECVELADASTVMTLTATQQLDYGTLIWATDDTVAACLLPTETAVPLTQIGLIALDEGTCTTIVENAVGESEGFEIYDVRATSQGVIWIEANILEGTWRVYHTAIDISQVLKGNTADTSGESGESEESEGSGTSRTSTDSFFRGTTVLAAQGDADWEMPTLAAVQNYAFWQILPRVDGEAAQEDSKLYRAVFGQSTSDEVYASHGRMACAPYACEDGVVITPRVDAANIYYQLTYIDAASAEVKDTLILPASMKPLDAGYGETGFSFMFDAIYDYGGGIANLGTYTAAESVTPHTDPEQSAQSYDALEWFRYPRTPTTAPAWCGDWFMVKSSSAVCGVNFDRRQYFALDVEEGADDYGDFLATTGTRTHIVTYSNINYTTIDGEEVKHCLVRVWQKAG